MNIVDSQSLQQTTLRSIFTCIYFIVFIFILFYQRSIYNIGKCSCLPLIFAIIFTECLKLRVCKHASHAGHISERSNRPKKTCYKNKFRSLWIILGTTVVYYAVAVLFGAPFLSKQEETLMFSVLLTSLTVVPSCLNLGADATVSLLVNLTTAQGDIFMEAMKCNICTTLLGAWVGAIVIPLDWDRAWQSWPIPCSFGAICGYACSQILILSNIVPRFNKLLNKRTGRFGL